METHPVLDVDPVQDFVPPRDHFTQGRLPQTEQENTEHDTTATIHTTAEPVVQSTAIPPTISTSVLQAIPSGKFFLDVCSGVTRPLSMAILDHGHPVLSFDILLDSSMDILSDAAYEDLLRVAASGQVGYGAASPSCCEYSRLKLRDDGGPKALRSPDHLSGLPNLTSWELQRVQESFVMLSRCVEVLTLVFQAGGHVHLEQPLNAMSWLEKIVRQFLQLIGASCINVAACAYEMDVYKAWMFASSFPGLRPMGCICQHPPNSHVRLQGLKDDWCFRKPGDSPISTKVGTIVCNSGGPFIGHLRIGSTVVFFGCTHAHQTTVGLSICPNRWGWSFFPPGLESGPSSRTRLVQDAPYFMDEQDYL